MSRPDSYVAHGIHLFHDHLITRINRDGPRGKQDLWEVKHRHDVLHHTTTLREAKAWVIDQMRRETRRQTMARRRR